MTSKEEMRKCCLPDCKNPASMTLLVTTSVDTTELEFCLVHGEGLIEAQEDSLDANMETHK